MAMTEIERESELADRAEELGKIRDRQMLSQMVRASDARDGATAVRGSSRKTTTTGKTESKGSALDELKKRRESKKRRQERVSAFAYSLSFR